MLVLLVSDILHKVACYSTGVSPLLYTILWVFPRYSDLYVAFPSRYRIHVNIASKGNSFQID